MLLKEIVDSRGSEGFWDDYRVFLVGMTLIRSEDHRKAEKTLSVILPFIDRRMTTENGPRSDKARRYHKTLLSELRKRSPPAF